MAAALAIPLTVSRDADYELDIVMTCCRSVLVTRKHASPRQGTFGMVGGPKQVEFAVEELARCVAKCALAKLEILPIQC